MFALASDVTLRDDSLKEYVSSGFIRQAGVACSLVGLACQSTPHVLREKKKKKNTKWIYPRHQSIPFDDCLFRSLLVFLLFLVRNRYQYLATHPPDPLISFFVIQLVHSLSHTLSFRVTPLMISHC